MSINKPNETEAERILRERELNSSIEYDMVEETKQIPPQPLSLGKVEIEHAVLDKDFLVGWKPMPVENLPSQGRFYPDDVLLEIRAAEVSEIRHFSTLDENDPLDMDDKLNMIIDKCMRIRWNGKQMTWKDLKEEDRFYLIFAIRELTFQKGENKLMLPIQCGISCAGDGSFKDKIEIKKEIFDYYTIEDKLMRFYDKEEKCFVINSPKVGVIRLYVPSLGVTSFIKSYMRRKIKENQPFDKAFLKISPFMFNDWHTLTDKVYDAAVYDSLTWSPLKLSAVIRAAEMIRFGVKTEITTTCNQCGQEIRTEMTFPGGIRSLFLQCATDQDDPFDQLF